MTGKGGVLLNKRERGSAYEKRASLYLEQNGVKVIERNFRCRMGEIDIIGIEPKDKELIFIEVKYRKTAGFGGALEAVGLRKQSIICGVSDYYRIGHKQFMDYSIRYDVVAFDDEKIKWIKNAFLYVGRGF